MDPNRFKEPVKETLAKRLAQTCSNPDCRIPTSGPSKESSNKSINVGEAAHIKGANPGSARYDSSMSPEERRSIENGIWLCRTHAKMIDSDHTTYTTELLNRWKEEHESWVQQLIESGNHRLNPNRFNMNSSTKDLLAVRPAEHVVSSVLDVSELVNVFVDSKRWGRKIRFTLSKKAMVGALLQDMKNVLELKEKEENEGLMVSFRYFYSIVFCGNPIPTNQTLEDSGIVDGSNVSLQIDFTFVDKIQEAEREELKLGPSIMYHMGARSLELAKRRSALQLRGGFLSTDKLDEIVSQCFSYLDSFGCNLDL